MPDRTSAAEARAEAEARRAAGRAAREAALAAHFGDGPLPGRPIFTASWVATLLFSVTAVAAAVAPDRFMAPAVVVSGVLFLAGTAIFPVVLVLAAGRSRRSLMGMGGLFLLLDAAPARAKWHLLGSVGVQFVVSIATAAVHPFTPAAFGTLVPLFGIALTGLWAVRYGWFVDRPEGAAAPTGPAGI